MKARAIPETGFHFPHQTAVYHGKVRDMYSIGDSLVVAVATDRISAFDVILPAPIPYKGQVLNQMAAHFLEATKDIAPNWLLGTPDPNVSIGRICEPFKVEMVIRGSLVGHAWRQYKKGVRELCGISLPDNLQEYDPFPEPIITPSTKANVGHDEDISAAEIIQQGIVTQAQWNRLADLTQKLFARGQAMARERGLVLADTKYEFGRRDSQIYVIDEVHTADSSRYFYADSYDRYLKNRIDKPKHLSKEFVREWLMTRGFDGHNGQAIPPLTNDFITSVSQRYIELYEQLTGQTFRPPPTNLDPLERIEINVKHALDQLR